MLLIENLLLDPCTSCPGFSPKENCLLLQCARPSIFGNVSLGAGFTFPPRGSMSRILIYTPPSTHLVSHDALQNNPVKGYRPDIVLEWNLAILGSLVS